MSVLSYERRRKCLRKEINSRFAMLTHLKSYWEEEIPHMYWHIDLNPAQYNQLSVVPRLTKLCIHNLIQKSLGNLIRFKSKCGLAHILVRVLVDSILDFGYFMD